MAKKEGFLELYKIVCSILSRQESSVFREPVDWKNLGLNDYPEIVKFPMDLGTIKSKIETEKYASIEDIVSDVRLVWSNCMLYNRDGSEVFYFILIQFCLLIVSCFSITILRISLRKDLRTRMLLCADWKIARTTWIAFQV